jgi:hypothetical protein
VIADLDAQITAMDGLRVPGGCEYCDAYQEVQANHYGTSAHRIVIAHDPWCPMLAPAFKRKS